MERSFPASLSTSSKMITAAVSLLGILSPLMILRSVNDENAPWWVVWLLPVLLVAIVVVSFFRGPSYYRVGTEGMRIVRRMGSVLLPANEIVEVRRVSHDEMGFPVRIFGNGGMFGFTGWYHSGKMGRMQWYCTRRENFVVIGMDEKHQRVITPDEPAALVSYWYEVTGKKKPSGYT
jgi:hypothetical protein